MYICLSMYTRVFNNDPSFWFFWFHTCDLTVNLGHVPWILIQNARDQDQRWMAEDVPWTRW